MSDSALPPSESSSTNWAFSWDHVFADPRAEDPRPNDRIVSELVQLGLSKDQARVYASGARLGKANAKTIAKESSLDVSTTYARLKELANAGLFEIELGTPNLYVARCPDLFLQKRKSELVEREQIVDQLGSELAQIQALNMMNFVERHEPSYKVVFNRALHFNSSLKLWKESKKEVLMITPARIMSKMVNERLEFLEESYKKGVKWRWLTDVKQSNLNDVELIAKYSIVRHCANISLSLGIFDRSEVIFCINPTLVSTSSDSREVHFTFIDRSVAQAFVLFFESLWKASVDVMTLRNVVGAAKI